MTAVFGGSSSLSPLADMGCKLIWVSLFLVHFDAQQCRGGSRIFVTLCSITFWSNFVCSVLLDLDSYCGNNFDGMFPLFYKHVAQELAHKLAATFRHLANGVVLRYAGN